jgi:DNA-binding IclR family transcriptional regulator
VTAIALVRDELVLAAAAGRTELAVAPTRVGQRLPFLPPLGSCFAAWGDDRLRRSWTESVAGHVTPERLEAIRSVPDLVRSRGYAICLGHQQNAHLESMTTRVNEGDPQVSVETLREAIVRVVDGYNPPDPITTPVELRSVSVPVFGAGGRVAFTLTVWGPPGAVDAAGVAAYVDAANQAAEEATASIGGIVPEGGAVRVGA